MISKELRNIFAQAVTYAKTNRHEYLTCEHIFLMLLHDEIIESLLFELGVDNNSLFDDIKSYIENNTPILPPNIEDEPLETVLLSSTIEYMIAHTQGSGKTNASVEDMFIAILREEKAYISHIFKKIGIEKVDILEEISHKEDDLEEEYSSPKKKDKILENNSVDLVSLAKKGDIDPVIGRTKEISRVIEILSRRKKNNPILVGEPGVGKTAIAEGLALQIASKQVPRFLENAKVFSLDMGSLIAGTKYRGDFEKKLKSLLKEVIKIPNAILFIDEIHTIVGAGSVGSSSMDASNILKPFLSNGKLKCIGATTFSEFRNDFAKDKALSRRFAKVDIEEPNIENSINILEGLKKKYEEYHGIKYSKSAIKAAVELSKKYINDRFLPDCAIDVIDEVGASKKIFLDTLKTKATNNITIKVKDIEDTISKIAHIPAKSASKSDISLLKSLEKNMKKRVFGQDDAILKIVQSIKRNKAGLGLDSKPIGSFLFTGPTGVGKTEVAKELANQLGINFERFDMSEYMEAHSISRLIGAPAGYIGFEQGGLLTETIRKHPHTVLLLDEIEKAHPDLMSILLQVMDNAQLTDNSGNKADFQNVILIMTSNLGASEANVMGFAKDDSLNENKAIKRFFAPEFRNRLDNIVSFANLSLDIVSQIVAKFIKDLELALSDKNIQIHISQKAKKELARLGYDKTMGARPLSRVISQNIKDTLSDEILFGKLKKGGKVNIDFKDEFIFKYEN